MLLTKIGAPAGAGLVLGDIRDIKITSEGLSIVLRRFAGNLASPKRGFGHENDRAMTAEGSDNSGDVREVSGQF